MVVEEEVSASVTDEEELATEEEPVAEGDNFGVEDSEVADVELVF